MKTRIIASVMALSISAITGISLFSNSHNDLMDLNLSNIEALAQGEVGFEQGVYYIVDVTENSHRCVNGGPFSCNID